MDPISDMFIRIKNAYRAGHKSVLIPHSKFKQEIIRVLERAGLAGHIERRGKRVRKIIEVNLKYDKDGNPALSGIKFISKPSRRIYSSYEDIQRAREGGIVVISTSHGVMSGSEARKAKVGGEVIAEIW